jgi:hypothetical protein
MSSSNFWAEFVGVFCQTRTAYLDHDAAKAELKKLMPEDEGGRRAGHPGQALQIRGHQSRFP